jgi:hypothetical protein
MGYATVMRVPRITTYAEALRKYDNTKPIKGRHGDPRPLGERRDVDTYSIRKNVWTDAMELVLYKTPVIKFTVEDEVVISFGTWSSASTCQFISRVLCVPTNRVRGDVVMHFSDGTKAMVRDHEELVLVRVGGRWQPKQKQTLYDYRVNRKEANAVRKSVSQFKDYLAGVVKLKGEEVVHHEGSIWEQRYTRVCVTYADLVELFGKEEDAHGQGRPNVSAWEKIIDKPKWFRPDNRAEVWANYRDKTERFFDLVRNDQDDNARHQNYWIAFNILMLQGQSMWFRADMNMTVTLSAESFDKFLDTILFKMFSDKVFNKVALAEGKVPTGKYDEYVTTEED